MKKHIFILEVDPEYGETLAELTDIIEEALRDNIEYKLRYLREVEDCRDNN